MAESLELFYEEHHDPERVCHLKAIADRLLELEEDPDVQAITFCHTSCGDDHWWVYQPEDEDSIPYDLNTMEDHWFLELR